MVLFKALADHLNDDGTHQADPAALGRLALYDDLCRNTKEGAKVVFLTTNGIQGQNLSNVLPAHVESGSEEEKESRSKAHRKFFREVR